MGGEQHGEITKLYFESVGEMQYILGLTQELIACEYPNRRNAPHAFDDQPPLVTDLENTISRNQSGEHIPMEIVGMEADVLIDALRYRAANRDLVAQAMISDLAVAA